jgi:hypothetical protein
MKGKTLIWLTVFAVSMGYFEAAVVVYIREILYPEGFDFPLQPIVKHLATTEVFREVFSLLMLLSVAFITGKNNMERFASFMLSFAVWDIFYYVFLKLLLNWPESLFTMDVLFLIPIVWIGPVICPIILSALMIILALMIIKYPSGSKHASLKWHEWCLLITGSLTVIVSFMLDFFLFVVRQHAVIHIWSVPMHDLFDLSLLYYPEKFHWAVFWVGVGLIAAGIVSVGYGMKVEKNVR